MNDTEARRLIASWPLIPARDQFGLNAGKNLVVLHSMEILEGPKTAESCANYFRNPERTASTQLCCDENSTVRTMDLLQTPAGAAGMNRTGIHIEQAGYAAQTYSQWRDPSSLSMIRTQVAPAVAACCVVYDIPVRFVASSELRANPNGAKGITTHAEGYRAGWGDVRTDPGANYPLNDILLPEVTRLVGGGQPGEDDMANYRDWTVEDKDALASDVARKVREEINGWLDAQRGPGKHGNGKNLDDVIDAVSQRVMSSDQHPNLGDVINEIRGNPTAP